MKKVVAFLVLGCTLVLMSCGSSTPEAADGSEAAPQPPEKPRVALVMKSLANEFFKTMEASARAYHDDHAETFDLISNGIKNEEDVSGQIALVEQMVAQGVNAIVIAPANSQALVPVLKRAVDRGIVVVNIDNKLDPEVLSAEQVSIPFIGPDNRSGAKLAGDHLAQSLEAGDPVAIIGGIPSAFNAIQRAQGFEDAMAEAGMKIAARQAGNWEMEKANQVASGIINEHDGLRAMLCANDNMALGALAAVREAGKRDEILVSGYDNIKAARELVQTGELDCTVEQHGDLLAVYGIEYALEILESGEIPGDRETPVELVTRASLQTGE
jgi:ribose transport system substrate-binding protein